MDEDLFSFHTCTVDARDEEVPFLTTKSTKYVPFNKQESVFDDWTADTDFALT